MHLSLLLSIFGAAASLQLQRLTFPRTDDYKTDCTLPDGEQGVCRSIRNCPTAFHSREQVKTCYFERFEQFVCCNKAQAHPSDIACETFYPQVFSIISGIRTSANEFPYMVALGWPQADAATHDFKCGGALIAPNFVLTAAHCTSVGGLSPVVVLPGGKKLSDATAKRYQIAQVIVHPRFHNSRAYHDIALLRLQESITDQVPACLKADIPLRGVNVTAIGYGHTVFAGRPSDELLKAYLSIVSNRVCQQYYINFDSVPNGIHNTQLCAKDNAFGRDTCQGDSGGPIVHLNFGKPYIVGVTSFGQGCATDAPGVYTRISKYMDWIESIVWPTSGRR